MEYLLKRFLEAKYEYLRIGLGVLEHKVIFSVDEGVLAITLINEVLAVSILESTSEDEKILLTLRMKSIIRLRKILSIIRSYSICGCIRLTSKFRRKEIIVESSHHSNVSFLLVRYVILTDLNL